MRPPHRSFELIGINWFEQVVDGRIAKSADGKLIGSGHENDPGCEVRENFQQIKTSAVAEQDIEKINIRGQLTQQFCGTNNAGRSTDHLHVRAIRFQVMLQDLNGVKKGRAAHRVIARQAAAAKSKKGF